MMKRNAYSIRPPVVERSSGPSVTCTISTVASRVASDSSTIFSPRLIPGQSLQRVEVSFIQAVVGDQQACAMRSSSYLRPRLKAQSLESNSGLAPRNRSGLNPSGFEYSLSSREIALGSQVEGSICDQ